MKARLAFVAVTAFVFFGHVEPGASGEDLLKPSEPASLDTVEALCIERCRGHDTLTGRMRLQKQFTAPQGEVTSEAIGEYEHQRKGEKLMFRVELKMTVTTRAGGKESSAVQRILTLSDGQFSYTIAEMNGAIVSATKAISLPSQSVLADVHFFKTLRDSYTLRVMPDEKVDGHDVWVIEARPRKQAPGGPAKTLHYLIKESGIRLRSTDHDASGARIQFTGLSDIKLDEPIDPKRFIFTVPKGVKVVDVTGA